MQVEKIAQVAQEINKAYCESIGDNSQPSWEDAPEWQKDSLLIGVQFHLDNPDAGPSASHESWLKQKEADGWKYGPEKNPEKKEHPCFVPYDELPVEQRAKDYIFRQVIHSLKDVNDTLITQENIAKFAYDMTIAYDTAYGYDVTSVKDLNTLSFDDKEMIKERVVVFLNNPQAASSEPYNIWLSKNITSGWKYGPVQDNAQKISPAIIPYEDLSVDRKIKDALLKQATVSLVTQWTEENTPSDNNTEKIQITSDSVTSDSVTFSKNTAGLAEVKPPVEDVPFREFSFGQNAVRPKNGGNPNDIELITTLYGQIIDVLNDMRSKSASQEQKRHLSIAITDAETAKFRSICGITWKD